MIFNLKDKVTLVTGGGSGIGRAIADCFTTQGASVCILDIHQPSDLQGPIYYPCNVANQTEVIAVVDQVIKKFGRIDILVNCAGVAHVANLEGTREEDFDRIFQINVKGVYNTMFGVLPKMKELGRGVILNMASVAGLVGVPERFSYTMSKGAVSGMTLSVARDYVKQGIRCNSISPARVHTPFVDGFLATNYPGKEEEMFDKLSKTQPIGRMAKPEEIAYLALYLCSEEASFVTGCDYPIDGGFTTLNN